MDSKQFYTIVGKQMFFWGVLLILSFLAVGISFLIKPNQRIVEVVKEKEHPKPKIYPAGMDMKEGKYLFKANCASCHKIDKESTGPALNGSRQRWIDAGEGELIYAFIRDNQALRDSDSSVRAKEVFEMYNQSPMTPFPNLTDEDIDNILFYAEVCKVQYAIP